MTKISTSGAIVLALSLTACGEPPVEPREEPGTASAESAAIPAGPAYSASGEVTAVSAEGVTIAHGPVAELDWPAMTMTFRSERDDMPAGINPGDRVSFSFRQSDGSYVLTSIEKN